MTSSEKSWLRASFLEFLSSSSIHGLAYLASVRSSIVRLLWLLSICACACAAAAVIYLNVLNWSNTPAVVTKVNPALAKGTSFMPMVTVCPRWPNVNSLVHRLLEEYPQMTEDLDLLSKVRDIISANLVAAKVAETELTGYYSTNTAKEMFEPCRDVLNGTAECDFVLLLSGIGNAVRYVDYNFEGVKEYIRHVALNNNNNNNNNNSEQEGTNNDGGSGDAGNNNNGENDNNNNNNNNLLSLGSLRDFVESYYGIGVGDKMEFPNFNYHYESVIEMYSFFFPVFKDSRRREIDVLRPLTDYQVPEIRTDAIDSQEFASLLAYMVDYNFMHDHDVLDGADALSNLTAEVMFSYSAKYLGLEDNIKRVYELVNSFSYDPVERPFFGYRPIINTNNSYRFFCNEEKDLFAAGNDTAFRIQELCRSGQQNLGEECARYCRDVVCDANAQRGIRVFYEMAADFAGLLRGGNPQTLLPVCRFPGEGQAPAVRSDCWTRVVNDRGVCFSSLTDGSRSEILGTGPAHAFSFAIDVGGRFYAKNAFPKKQLFQQEYDILVTPPNHFAAGRLAEESHMAHHYQAGDASRAWTIKVELDYIAQGTAEFRAMDPLKRNCLYPDEKVLSHFPAYSEPNCVLECAWNNASQTCGCVPWFLYDHYPESNICEAHGNNCFKTIVDSRYEQEQGACAKECLPDCETVEYSIQRPEKEHKIGFGDTGKTSSNALYYDYVTVSKVEHASEDVMEVIRPIQRSNSNLDNVGLVSVYVDKKSTLRIVLTATVTAIDMISNIGGTLGLFCGFSLLSAAEMVYWAAVALAGRRL